jgi:hypothetical protein
VTGSGGAPRTSGRRFALLLAGVGVLYAVLLTVFLVAGAQRSGEADGAMTVYAVGDIAGEGGGAERVANMLALHNFGGLLTLGDHAYEDGTAEEFASQYEPTFGQFDDRVRPTPGNHDYATEDAAPYFDYFGEQAPNFPDRPYYAFTLGSWRIYSLNSEIDEGQPAEGMYEWLRTDLAENETPCIAAYWHKPIWTVGAKRHDEGGMAMVWSLLAAHQADLVLTGHDHNYQRWEPIDGITSFVVGTGGRSRYPIESSDPSLAFATDDAYGALALDLEQQRATFAFHDVDDRVLDSGTVDCNPKQDAVASPPAEPTELTTTEDAGGVHLAWQPVQGDERVIGYVVYRGGEVIGFTSEETFDDPNAVPAESVLYTVRAVMADGTRSRPSGAAHAGIELLGFTGFRWATEGENPSAPTADKPQSKLWYADGTWWGILYSNPRSDLPRAFYIQRFDAATQSWSNTGVAVDNRDRSHADALWDEASSKLYVASTIRSGAAKLYRYSYRDGTWSADEGYPIRLTENGSESITIAKDADDRLWATISQVPDGSGACAEDAQCSIRVLHSLDHDYRWSQPMDVPVGATLVREDDISAIVSLAGGDQIGVVWSNQLDGSFQLAIHEAGAPDTSWSPQTIEVAPRASDDHINLKTDAAGRLYMVVKTSLNDVGSEPRTSPLIVVYVREPNGVLRSGTVWTIADDVTRAQLVVDDVHGRILVAGAQPGSGGAIYYKTASISDLVFDPGLGTPIVASGSVNNPTMTKQTVDLADGVLILAGDSDGHTYWQATVTMEP